MTEPDAELLAIFREETSERLDRIEATLLAFEAGAADGDRINALFRDAHSIKGNAGMVGFEDARRLAHAMEDVLEVARASGVLDPARAAALLVAVDAIRDAVREAPAPSPSPSPAPSASPAASPAASASASPSPAASRAPAPSASPSASASVAEALLAPSREPQARSMRVAVEKVDRLVDVVGEAVLHRRRLDHLVRGDAMLGPALEDELGAGALLLDELQDAVVRMRTQPLASITARYPRAVRDLSAAAGKRVRLELEGTATQLDRVILDGISETLVHLLRNAIFHGVEAPAERVAAGKAPEARVVLRADPQGDFVAVSVSDDGRGVSPELLARARDHGSLAAVLAEAGVSTAGQVTDLAGRGVGLDAVKRHVESLGGSLEAESQPGRGSRMTLRLPVTLALMHLLLLERGAQVFGVPLASVTEVLVVVDELSLGGRRSLEVGAGSVPLLDLADVLGAVAPAPRECPPALLVRASGRLVALICDAVLGEAESVVKPFGPLLRDTPGYLGAAILADGRIALVLDPTFLCLAPTRERIAEAPHEAARAAPKVLVVDDQPIVRELQRSILEAAGYRVRTAASGLEALDVLAAEADVDLVVTDIEMPEMNGLALVGAIRRREPGGALPVVIVSSRGGEEDRRRGSEAGADAYIAKSDFHQESLLATVARLVRSP